MASRKLHTNKRKVNRKTASKKRRHKRRNTKQFVGGVNDAHFNELTAFILKKGKDGNGFVDLYYKKETNPDKKLFAITMNGKTFENISCYTVAGQLIGFMFNGKSLYRIEGKGRVYNDTRDAKLYEAFYNNVYNSYVHLYEYIIPDSGRYMGIQASTEGASLIFIYKPSKYWGNVNVSEKKIEHVRGDAAEKFFDTIQIVDDELTIIVNDDIANTFDKIYKDYADK